MWQHILGFFSASRSGGELVWQSRSPAPVLVRVVCYIRLGEGDSAGLKLGSLGAPQLSLKSLSLGALFRRNAISRSVLVLKIGSSKIAVGRLKSAHCSAGGRLGRASGPVLAGLRLAWWRKMF